MTRDRRPSLTSRLARAVTTARVPHSAVGAVPALLEDHVASALLGTEEPAFGAVLATSAPGASPVIGRPGVTRSAADAALLGGFAAHLLDLDDASEPMRGHPSAVLFPALAVLAPPSAEGADVAAAYAIGLDVMARIGRALGPAAYTAGFHQTGLVGGIGAAAAGARLRGLDEAAAVRAIGHAAQQAGGLRSHFGSQAKPLVAGLAARSAVEAVEWAEAGVTASDDALGDPHGFFTAFRGAPLSEAEAATLLDGFGDRWSIVDDGVWMKRGPFCSAGIAAVDAALEAAPVLAGSVPDAVRVEVRPGATDALVVDIPETGEQGRFSLRYLVSLALLGIPLDLAALGAGPANPDAVVLARRVEASVVPDPEAAPLPPGVRDRTVDLAVSVAGREKVQVRVDVPSGSPARPLTAGERKDKLRAAAGDAASSLRDALARFAERPWGETAAAILAVRSRAED